MTGGPSALPHPLQPKTESKLALTSSLEVSKRSLTSLGEVSPRSHRVSKRSLIGPYVSGYLLFDARDNGSDCHAARSRWPHCLHGSYGSDCHAAKVASLSRGARGGVWVYGSYGSIVTQVGVALPPLSRWRHCSRRGGWSGGRWLFACTSIQYIIFIYIPPSNDNLTQQPPSSL